MLSRTIHALAGLIVCVNALNPATQVSEAASPPHLQKEASGAEASTAKVPDLPLDASLQLRLKNDFQRRDYEDAEGVLLNEVKRDPNSARSAKLLSVVGGIFFLDRKYAESVIAWKQSEAIAPLDDPSRFTLAMAYIHLDRRDLARPELERLTEAKPENSLYLYWLARLDYDQRNYVAAIGKLQKVIALDTGMVRAYDILGFCQHYLGRADEARNDFRRAIELNRQQAKPSPWPPLDFAVILIEENHLDDAEKNVHEAIGYGPGLPQAHFQLGRVLEKQNREREAIDEFRHAAELDESYPDPHYHLGHIYRRIGQKQLSEEHINQFLLLKRKKNGTESMMNSQEPPAQP